MGIILSLPMHFIWTIRDRDVSQMGRGICQCPAAWWRFLPSIRQHRVADASRRAPGECCSPAEAVSDGKGFPETSQWSRVLLIEREERGNRGFKLRSCCLAQLDQTSLLNSPFCTTPNWQFFQYFSPSNVWCHSCAVSFHPCVPSLLMPSPVLSRNVGLPLLSICEVGEAF